MRGGTREEENEVGEEFDLLLLLSEANAWTGNALERGSEEKERSRQDRAGELGGVRGNGRNERATRAETPGGHQIAAARLDLCGCCKLKKRVKLCYSPFITLDSASGLLHTLFTGHSRRLFVLQRIASQRISRVSSPHGRGGDSVERRSLAFTNNLSSPARSVHENYQ